MHSAKSTGNVPIEARLRNDRRLITTIPPIALVVAAALAVAVGPDARPAEVAGAGRSVVSSIATASPTVVPGGADAGSVSGDRTAEPRD